MNELKFMERTQSQDGSLLNLFVTFKFEFVGRGKVVLEYGELIYSHILKNTTFFWQHLKPLLKLHFRMTGSRPHLTFHRTPAG